MKNIISLLSMVAIIAGCTEQDYFEIPRDANGNVLLTGISSTSSTGISTLDNEFTVTATFATAKPGDVMLVELLQLQVPPGGTTKQLLPMEGTQKQVTVGSDLTATVSYTRAEAKLNVPSDYVTVVFNGETDYAKVRVDMVPATTISKPKVSTREIEVARTSETAYIHVTVDPKATTDYTGTLIVQRKNGQNGTWVDVAGSPFSGTQPFLVPISGADFAVGQDTMYYSFTASAAGYTDVVTTTTVVIDPYFFFKKSGSLALGGTSAGRNLIDNTAVPEDDPNAMLAVSSGSLILKGGSSWLAAGNSIQFVPSTNAMYSANNTNAAIAAFESGVKSTTADPIEGEGVFIFKAVNGPDPEDVYYGMIKVTNVIPGSSLTYENRIGDRYAHLLVVQ